MFLKNCPICQANDTCCLLPGTGVQDVNSLNGLQVPGSPRKTQLTQVTGENNDLLIYRARSASDSESWRPMTSGFHPTAYTGRWFAHTPLCSKDGLHTLLCALLLEYIRGFGQVLGTQPIKQNKEIYIMPRTGIGKDIPKQRDMPSIGPRAFDLFVRKYSRPKAHSYAILQGPESHTCDCPPQQFTTMYL